MAKWINISPMSFTIDVDGVPTVVPSRAEFEAPAVAVHHLVRLGRVVPAPGSFVERDEVNSDKRDENQIDVEDSVHDEPTVEYRVEASSAEEDSGVEQASSAEDDSEKKNEYKSSDSDSGNNVDDVVDSEPKTSRKRRGRRKRS